uniref:TIP120 domain-containing protein n=2 Tax=Bursaphelenchus xylophilus TaxID=6326 RepID=A0A1I7RSB0_BURXY
MTAQVQISSLLEKMTSVDKDFRFMATNDLMGELEKEALKLDDEIERKITRTLLKLLDDKNGEVQNLAVRCLAPLMNKAKHGNVELIIQTLCHSLQSPTERYRDVSSIALKTAVAELSSQMTPVQTKEILDTVLPELLKILREDGKQDSAFKIEITDILGILITKFGHSSYIDFKDIVNVLFIQLSKDRQSLRKRAISVLGQVAEVVDDEVYVSIVNRVFEGIQNGGSNSVIRAHVLAASTVSRSGRGLKSRLPEFIKLLVKYCQDTDDDELKDACVHAFEVFISRCNKEITPYLSDIEGICAEFIRYDPNYQYDDENGDDSMEVDAEEENDEEDDLDDYSDDDDFSWKVRRSAAKCYEALINYRTDRLGEHFTNIAPLLLNRFKEREENVKIDVFKAYEALLKQTRLYLPEKLAQFDNSTNISPFTALEAKNISFSNEMVKKVFEDEADGKQKAVLTAYNEQVPKCVKAICKQLKSKSANVRLHCYSLLTSLVRAFPGCLERHFEILIPLIQNSVNEESADNATKIDTLQFLNLSFCSHEPQVFVSHFESLVAIIIKCVNESFYKVSAAALIVLQSLIIVLKRTGEGEKYLESIYNVIVSKLKVGDIDQEVKERSIAAGGVLLSSFGAELGPKLEEILPLLLDKINNEITRPTTVQAFCVIVNSSETIDLSLVLDNLLLQLSDFLRKNQRALKIASLTLMSSLVSKYPPSQLPSQGISKVINELPVLMVESDLFISQLSLRLAKDFTQKFPSEISPSLGSVIEASVTLANNSLLVGNMLQWAVDLFVNIACGDIPGKPDFLHLMELLTLQIYNNAKGLSRQTYQSVAVIMANATKAVNDVNSTTKIVTGLIQVLSKDDGDGLGLFALTALGELGRIFPDSFQISKVDPEELITNSFNSTSEERKTAASFAFGALACGNLEKYLPALLNEISSQPNRQYVLLHALKEVIISQNTSERSAVGFNQAINNIWDVLVAHSGSKEESTRSVVAECMGRLCRINLDELLPRLIECSTSGNPKQRSTAAGAVRFMIVDSKAVSNDALRNNLGSLLRAIDDDELDVRRTTIMTLNSAAHNKPRWIKELLPTLLPSLYRETEIRKDLIHEVQMGPFKHVVDDGLDLRKSAYECMYTLMEHCLDRINVSEYMTYVEKGLQDSHDIKLLNLLMLTRLAQTCSAQVAQRIDRFADLLSPLLVLKAKESSVKQESDKIEELKRACIRTILSLKRIPAMERSARLQSCFETVQHDQKLKSILDSLEKDNTLKLLSVHNQDIQMEGDY